MESVFHYHTFSEAQEIKQTYSSWIGKKAHTGMGQQELLRDITLKSGNTVSVGEHPDQAYYLEFVFENKVLNVYEFTVGNGLMPITGTLSFAELKQHIKPALPSGMFSQNLFPI
jgi:hypothetical protein